MTDRPPTEEEERAWLLARERGEPAPPLPEARARRYGKLGTQIANLPAVPAGAVEREGWEQIVLAALDATPDETAVPSMPVPMIAGRGRRWRTAATTAAAFAMVASVAIVVIVRRDTGPEIHDGGSDVARPERPVPPQVPEATRGAHIEPGGLGFDHTVHVRRSEIAAPHELRDGDTVATGDRIRASVTTSSDAYVYLAFCANQRLQLYPSPRGVRTRAEVLVIVPAGGRELVVDDHAGPEVLYLIVSRSELAAADPQLAALVAGDGAQPVDCGASLDLRLMKTGQMRPTHVLRGQTTAGDRAMIAADASGIAIVRYRFVHAAER